MAEDHLESRQSILWTKIFSTFKIALDAKKLILAGMGILATALGWWALSWAFYSPRSLPEWNNYTQDSAGWKDFRADLASWNLLHELAAEPEAKVLETVADIAGSSQELKWLRLLEERTQNRDKPIQLQKGEQGWELSIENKKSFKITPLGDTSNLMKSAKNLALKDLKSGDQTISIQGTPFRVETNFAELEKLVHESSPDQLIDGETDATERDAALKAKKHFDEWKPLVKKAGRLRTLPWFEHRGPNPYLMVSTTLHEFSAGKEKQPHGPGHYVGYFLFQLTPVLLEPIFKFLTPVTYLLDSRAGKLEKLYLCLVILYTLVVWGYFGGAITRLAAVQFARNDRLSLREALGFAQQRFISYVAAPVFPLLCLAFLTCLLVVFGLLELIPVFGDIVIAGLFWPVALLIGLVMAVVVVGLLGIPLMHATISTEGSDSFDALSRSYSYVYGAPWQFLWYSLVAAVYGAVVVFFITFMGSLLVYAAKWGVGHTPGMASWEREPTYLFVHAPTSFGWRDLLIHDNPSVSQIVISPETQSPLPYRYEVQPDYYNKMQWWNKTGAIMVTFWIYAFFLLMIGFSYSFFWTASTIIYFLMRRHVDETDFDEVHLDSDGKDEPFPRSGPSTSTPPASKPNTISLTTVEAPTTPTSSNPATPSSRPEISGG